MSLIISGWILIFISNLLLAFVSSCYLCLILTLVKSIEKVKLGLHRIKYSPLFS